MAAVINLLAPRYEWRPRVVPRSVPVFDNPAIRNNWMPLDTPAAAATAKQK